MRTVENLSLPGKTMIKGFEGGAVYAADKGGKFYLVLDEGTMADLLGEEDREGIEFVKTLEFDTPAERDAHIAERGWK